VAEDVLSITPIIKRAVVSSGQVLPKASVATDCQAAPIGIYDFSGMSALDPAAANHWQINF
jgi:hypothetical protein